MTRVEARIAVAGRDAEEAVYSLYAWLQDSSELRRHLHAAPIPTQARQMDASLEIVVAIGPTAARLFSLVRGLVTWLDSRRFDATITVTAPYGQAVTLSATRVADLERQLAVLEGALQGVKPGSPPPTIVNPGPAPRPHPGGADGGLDSTRESSPLIPQARVERL